MRTRYLCYLVILSLAACAQQQDLEQERKSLLETDRKFAQASIDSGATAAFHAFLADSAIMFPAGANPIAGRESIREAMAASPGGLLTWEPQHAEVAAAADLGWTWGTYKSQLADKNDQKQIRYGKYVNIWQKQPDGTWRVSVDIGNASPPPHNVQ